MKNIFLFIFSAYFYFSCGTGENAAALKELMQLSENENNGITEVLEFYGGNCNYNKGFTTRSGVGKRTYFKITLDETSNLSIFSDRPALPLSNIAYLFYRNLGEERKKYDEIQVNLIVDRGQQVTASYEPDELEPIFRRMGLIDSLFSLFKSNSYESLLNLIPGENIADVPKSEFLKVINSLDAKYGKVITEFLPAGYGVYKNENGVEMIHIAMLQKREKGTTEFSIDTELHSELPQLTLMNFKF